MRTRLLTAAFLVLTPLSASAATTPVNLTCMQQAVAVRETSMLSTFSTYTQTVMSAFQQRMSALQSAWSVTDENTRKNTIKTAWSTYESALKNAKTQLKNSRKNTWKTFKDSRKACNGPSNSDPGGGESLDSRL